MAYPSIYWGATGPERTMPPAFGPDGRVIPFDQRGRAGATATMPPPVVPGSNAPTLPDYGNIEDIIGQINATNQQAQTSALNNRIPMASELQQQSSQNIAALLNPPTQFGELDVPAASAGVASGTVGSPFAGMTGIRLTENERLRRMGLGEQFLSGALARNPIAPIADPQSLLHLLQQQQFGAEQAAQERALRERIANAQMANAALLARNRGYSSGGGGGGGTAPRLPTDYTRPMAAGGTRPNIPPYNPGPGMLPQLVGEPNIGNLDNWYDLTSAQQQAFNTGFGQNPYFGLPDWQNPYSGDEPPAAPAPPLPTLGFNADAEDFWNYA